MLDKITKWLSKVFYSALSIAFVVLLAFVSVSIYLFVVLCDFVYFVWEKIWGGKEHDGG